MKNNILKRSIIVLLSIVFIFSSFPLTSLAETSQQPVIGSNINAASDITVNNNGVDATETYKNSSTINVATNTSGVLGNMNFYNGIDCEYYFAADVNTVDDSTNYGSIRLRLGYVVQNDVNKYIELCYRPGLNHSVAFLNGNGESALDVGPGADLQYNTSYRCVAVYNKGYISLWANGSLLIDSVAIPNDVTDVVMQPGFYSQNCNGTISNIEIWGDVELASACPQIGSNINAASDITVNNNGVDATETYKNSSRINVGANTNGVLGNMYFYNGRDCKYYFAADVNTVDDSTSYGSIRLRLGYVVQNDVNKYIELCYRPGLNHSVAFLNGNGESDLNVGPGADLQYNTSYRCVAVYNKGYISLWANGNLLIDSVAIPNDVTNVVMQPGFYSQNCNGTISNIEIWGDVESASACPQIGINENKISEVTVQDLITGVYKKASDKCLSYIGDATDRTNFYGITYGSEYTVSTNARFYDNKTPNGDGDVNWEGLIFQLANASINEQVYNIDLRLRNNLVAVFAYNPYNSPPESVVYVDANHGFEYGKNYQYTVKYYKDKTFSLWINGENILSHFNLANYGYTDIQPNLSLGGEVCSYSYDDIKLWGDITVDSSQYSSVTELYNTNENFEYDLTIPQKPQNNKNYLVDSDIYTKANSDNSINTNIYLDYRSFKKLKRTKDNIEFGNIDFAIENAGTATDFQPDEEVVYDLMYNAGSNDYITVFARYFYKSNSALSFKLNNDGITVVSEGENLNFAYPEGTQFSGNHHIIVKMDGEYAILFVDDVPCAKVHYAEFSVPMFSVKTKDATVDYSNSKAYRTQNGADPTYSENRYDLGDANADYSFNLLDLVRFKKIFANVAEPSDSTVLDINTDSAFNSQDLACVVKALLNDGLGLGGNIEAFHDQSDYYMSTIQPDYNESVELKVRTKYNTVTSAYIEYSENGKNWEQVQMRFDGEDETGSYQYYKGTVPGQDKAFFYRFKLNNSILNKTKTLSGISSSGNNWYCMVGQITPDWAKGTLWYSLMPDAYFNGDLSNDKINSGENTVNSWNNVHTSLNDRYGGDLKGIEEKMDYIKSLGVESIYMNPISKSYQNAGYGTVDYNQIDSAFGNKQNLSDLISSVHNKNMKIMTDVTLYFSPVNSIYANQNGYNPLQGALQNQNSKYTGMFNFSSWPDYESTEWGGLKTNLFNNALQSILYKSSNSALRRLVGEYGFDGLRFDCGGYLGSKTDVSVRNNLIKDIRQNLKQENPNMLMLSEYDYEGMTGYGWDSQWNLDLRSAFKVFITGKLIEGETYKTSVSSLNSVLNRSLNKLPRQEALTVQNLISFHDDDRINTDSSAGRAATLIQMTYLGSPVIYYGDEIGLDRQSENGISQTSHAGTSFYAMDWNQKNWNQSKLSFYKTLGNIRNKYSALKTGAIESIANDDELGLLAYARYDENGAVITLANRGESIENYEIDVAKFGLADGSIVSDCFTGKNYVVTSGKVYVSISSGGTLLVSDMANDEVASEKHSTLYGAGSVTTSVNGHGAYSLTVNQNNSNNAAFYGAVINGKNVFVIMRRNNGGEVVKQCQFTLPDNAQLKINRDSNNVFSCSYLLNGEDIGIITTGAEISMDSEAVVISKRMSGNIIPTDIDVESQDNIKLLDDFNAVIQTASWNGIAENDNISLNNGKLSIVGSGSVSRTVPNDDWTAETLLTSGKGEIKVAKDDSNYISLRYSDKLQFVLALNGGEEVIAETNCSNDNGLYLQISRVGTDYAAYYSEDGNVWNKLGEAVYYNPSAVTLYLVSQQNASFDYFMFGDGTSECKPHIFAGDGFGYTEKRTEPKYAIQSGDFEYVNEGIKSTTSATSLMSITNIRYDDFYAQVTLNATGSTTKAGMVFGLPNANSPDNGYTMFINSGSLILKNSSGTLKRISCSDSKLTIWLKNGVLSVYSGDNSKYLFSIELSDYNGGYVGFYSKDGEVSFENYYVADISEHWMAVSGNISGDQNYVTISNIGNMYGNAVYRKYAFGDGTLNARISLQNSGTFYSGGLLLGTSYGKSPDNNGVFVGIENGSVVLKYNGAVIDSCLSGVVSADVSITSNNGHYTVTVNGSKTLSCYAPDCAGGCISICAVNTQATFSNLS